MSNAFSHSGLLPSPVIKIVKYDRWWCYMNSHNPQANRYDPPYPDLMVVGQNPQNPRRLDPPPLKEQKSKTPFVKEILTRKKKEKKDKDRSASGILLNETASHCSLNFRGYSVYDHHQLKLRDLTNSQEDDGTEHQSSMGIYSDSLDCSDGDVLPWEKSVKKDHAQMFFDARKKKASLVHYEEPPLVNATQESPEEHLRGKKSSTKDGNCGDGFQKHRRQVDAVEGAKIRESLLYHNPGTGRRNISEQRTGSITRKMSGSMEVFATLSTGSTRKRGSIVKDRVKTSATSSVAFHIPRPKKSRETNKGSFHEKRKSDTYREAVPLLMSSKKHVEYSGDPISIAKHEAHSNGFEQVRQIRILAEDKEEGQIFRLSFDEGDIGTKTSEESQASSVGSQGSNEEICKLVKNDNKSYGKDWSKVNLNGVASCLTMDCEIMDCNVSKFGGKQEDEIEKKISIDTNEVSEAASPKGVEDWRMYSRTGGGAGVVGFNKNVIGDKNISSLRHFRISRKEAPEDNMSLLIRKDGKIVGFISKATTIPESSEEKEEEDGFCLVYDTSDKIIGFSSAVRKTDHQGDFERVRKERLHKTDREEGLVFQLLRHLENSAQMVLDEGWSLNINE